MIKTNIIYYLYFYDYRKYNNVITTIQFYNLVPIKFLKSPKVQLFSIASEQY